MEFQFLLGATWKYGGAKCNCLHESVLGLKWLVKSN